MTPLYLLWPGRRNEHRIPSDAVASLMLLLVHFGARFLSNYNIPDRASREVARRELKRSALALLTLWRSARTTSLLARREIYRKGEMPYLCLPSFT